MRCVWGVSLRWPSLLSGEGYGLGEGVTCSLTHISQHRRPCTQGPRSHKHMGSIWGEGCRGYWGPRAVSQWLGGRSQQGRLQRPQ